MKKGHSKITHYSKKPTLILKKKSKNSNDYKISSPSKISKSSISPDRLSKSPSILKTKTKHKTIIKVVKNIPAVKVG